MRYALYFTPPADDPLVLAAARWLGRDAFSGRRVEQEQMQGRAFSAETLREATAAPRRYGFHATLKAPFALREAATPAALEEAFAGFAAETRAFDIPALSLARIGSFLALVQGGPCPALQELAARAVRRFEPLRAPLCEADMARRQPEKLTPAQREHLANWGYPYVFEEFRFHMTLTGALEPALMETIEPLLRERFSAFLGKPLTVSGLALFIEPEPGAAFTVHRWRPFLGLEA